MKSDRKQLDFILDNNEIENAYCILLDINMPLMNGLEFLDALKFLEKPINANKIEELKKHEALKKYF